jgi:hypothetical protein
MGFRYVAAVNTFFDINRLLLPDEMVPGLRRTGACATAAKSELLAARDAAARGQSRSAVQAASRAVAAAHPVVAPVARVAVHVMGTTQLHPTALPEARVPVHVVDHVAVAAPEYLLGAAANLYVASIALDAAARAQDVASNYGDERDNIAVADVPVVGSLAGNAVRANEALQAVRAASLVGNVGVARMHSQRAVEHGRAAAILAQLASATVMTGGPTQTSAVEHRAMSDVLRYTAITIAAAADSLRSVVDMDGNSAEQTNSFDVDGVSDADSGADSDVTLPWVG